MLGDGHACILPDWNHGEQPFLFSSVEKQWLFQIFMKLVRFRKGLFGASSSSEDLFSPVDMVHARFVVELLCIREPQGAIFFIEGHAFVVEKNAHGSGCKTNLVQRRNIQKPRMQGPHVAFVVWGPYKEGALTCAGTRPGPSGFGGKERQFLVRGRHRVQIVLVQAGRAQDIEAFGCGGNKFPSWREQGLFHCTMFSHATGFVNIWGRLQLHRCRWAC